MIEYLKIFLGPIAVLTSASVAIRHFKVSKSLSYIERFNSTSFAEARAEIEEWIGSKKTNKEKTEEATSNPRLFSKIALFANLFQELGVAYKYRLIHRKIAFENFDIVVIDYWERLEFWVTYRRKLNVKSRFLYRKYEYLYREFVKRRERSNRILERKEDSLI
jgi:hypothetical protein